METEKRDLGHDGVVGAPESWLRTPLERLQQAFLDKKTFLATVRGGRGVGKTQLLARFRQEATRSGAVVVGGRAELGLPSMALENIAQSALAILTQHGIAYEGQGLACSQGCHHFWFQHQTDTPEPELAIHANADGRVALFEGIAALVRALAEVSRPVIWLENLENAGLATLDALRFLLDDWHLSPPKNAPFIVLACTDDAAESSLADLVQSGAVITMGALDADGVRRFLVGDDVVREVMTKTGGHPDLIRQLFEADLLSSDERILGKWKRASQAVRDALLVLAVARAPMTHTDLRSVLGSCGAEPHAGANIAADLGALGLLQTTFQVNEFAFQFMRSSDADAVLRLAQPATVRSVHAALVEHSARSGRLAAAVQHALAAGNAKQAFAHGVAAAHVLVAQYGYSEATALLEELLVQVPAQAEQVRNELVTIYRMCGEYDKALAHLRALGADATVLAGELLVLSGRFTDAIHVLSQFASADAQAWRAEALYRVGDYIGAKQAAEQAFATSSVAPTGARNTLGKVFLALREWQNAIAVFQKNHQLAVARGDTAAEAQALTNHGVALLSMGHLEEAESVCRSALDAANRARDARKIAIALENLAALHHMRGQYGLALESYRRSLRIMRRLGNEDMLARLANNICELYLCVGDFAQAQKMSELVARLRKQTMGAAFSQILHSRLLRARGESKSAHKVLVDALTGLHERHETALLLEIERAEIFVADGFLDEATAILDRVETDCLQTGAKAAVQRLRATVARSRGEPSRALAGSALNTASALGPVELLAAHIELGETLVALDAMREARDVVERAHALDLAARQHVPETSLDSWDARPARKQLNALLERCADFRRQEWHPRGHLRAENWGQKFPNIVGQSARIVSMLSVLEKVAPSDASVLIRGESGTGKELVAAALHENSLRRGKPFVKVNCAALVESLLLSELFGHERGAFTGADARRKGRFELADTGTIFLDEIGDISPRTQVALLRVLQEREFERVGGTQSIKVDVRVVAATHRNLEQMVKDGTFREDLYYRLRGVTIEVPALRQRLSDMGSLAHTILAKVHGERGEGPTDIATDALHMLTQHRWPGNVRELENVLRSASLFAEGSQLLASDLAAFACQFEAPEERPSQPPMHPDASENGDVAAMAYRSVRAGTVSLFDMKKQIERECIVQALHESKGNITRAAALLGMKRPRLSQLVKEYDLGHLGREQE